MTALRMLPLAALLCLVAGHGRGQDGVVAGEERVLAFLSEITVLPDASLVVKETIRVRAAGRAIKHGIYRDLPSRFRGPGGIWFDVPLSVLEVRRDGRPEPYQIKEREHGLRAYIGDAERLLEPGEHTYFLAYRTERRVGSLLDHDELSWDVNGHDWTLPLDMVEARVVLPRGVSGVGLDVRTGVRGSTERAATAVWDGERVGLFRATRPLRPGENLSVSLRWPKGFVRVPVVPRRWWGYFLGGNRGLLAGAAGVLLVLTYHFLAGRHALRAMLRGVAAPSAEVPAGLSPAALRVIRTGRCDARALAATLVQMAVRGYLVVEERDGVYALHRGVADRAAVAPEEALIAYDLDLERSRCIRLEPSARLRLGAALNDLKNFLRVWLERFHALRNREYLLPGVTLSVVVLVATLSLEPGLQSFIRVLLSLLLFFWTIGAGLLGVQFAQRWQDVLSRPETRRDILFQAASITVLALPVALVELAGLGVVARLGSPGFSAILLCLALLNLSFHYLLKTPKRGSRVLLDRIEAFAVSLSGGRAGEGGLPGREPTAAQYEELLPYAIALDCERQWSERCAAALSPADGEGKRYEPGWYRTGSGGADRLAALRTGVIGDALCAALVAAVSGSAPTP